MTTRAVVRSLTAMSLCALTAACHWNVVALPLDAPYYDGIVKGSSFATASDALANLTRVDAWGAMHGAPGAPHGYFRIDTTTRFVIPTRKGLRWQVAGVPGLMGARIRVWLRNDRPTSLTEAEVWGNARLVVIDSVGAAPAKRRPSSRTMRSAAADSSAGTPDFSQLDEFWIVKDLLSADREPSMAEWQRLRATPGYGLIHRVEGDELLEDMRTAFKPSRRMTYDSLAKLGRGRGMRASHLVRAAALRPRLQAFRDSLVRSNVVARAVSVAARLLPPGVTDSSAPPVVAFALFADDGYSFGDSVLVDILHAYDSDVVSFLAHEFHHTYVERIAARPDIAVEIPEDRNLRVALENLRKEGIADLIDKPYPLVVTSPANIAYARKYDSEYVRTPATLHALDSLLRDVAADSTRMADVGKQARALLWSSGHANGAYMAREILTTFGVDSLLPATIDPAAFLRTFAAAERAMGRTAPFDADAMRMVRMFEQRYWSRRSAAECAAIVDSALAASRARLTSAVGQPPGQPRRKDPPRSFFLEFEVTTPAAIRGEAARSAGAETAADPIVQFVRADGSVDSGTVKVVADRSHAMTRGYLQELVRSLQFTPATVNGCPVSELLQMSIRP